MGLSWQESLSALTPVGRVAILDSLTNADLEALAYDWSEWRRPSQKEPLGSWRYWLCLSGRGWGKSRTGSEWVREKGKSGRFCNINIIGATVDDARDIMVEGESGILSVCPRHERPIYVPSKRLLKWPNGARTLIFSADKSERLKGKQHDALWADEIAGWRDAEKTWAEAKLGLRLGPDPRIIVTTTPKPLAMLRRLIRDPACHVTKGTTYENRANLAPAFFAEIILDYEGTALGRQELLGDMLEEAEGALWKRSWIDKYRVKEAPKTICRVAIGVDPPGGATECGIVAVALGEGKPRAAHKYILADTSGKLSALEWGVKAWRTAISVDADVIACEKNFGGDMVKANMAAASHEQEFIGFQLPRYGDVHASRNKAIRAEEWAAQTQQGRIHFVGEMDELEDELCNWEPGSKSPNRLDAMVWGLKAVESIGLVSWSTFEPWS